MADFRSGVFRDSRPVSPGPSRSGAYEAPLSTAFRSDWQMVHRGMGAAGQQKGRNHEKNQTRPGRRILDPHDHRLPLGWILFYFGSNRDARTNRDRIAVNFDGGGPVVLMTLVAHRSYNSSAYGSFLFLAQPCI